jgi:hypothetical protein
VCSATPQYFTHSRTFREVSKYRLLPTSGAELSLSLSLTHTHTHTKVLDSRTGIRNLPIIRIRRVAISMMVMMIMMMMLLRLSSSGLGVVHGWQSLDSYDVRRSSQGQPPFHRRRPITTELPWRQEQQRQRRPPWTTTTLLFQDTSASTPTESFTTTRPISTSPSASTTTTTVAIVGSGAVGGYYGSRLWEAGHTVKFYMRGDHYTHCKAHGLNVTVSSSRRHQGNMSAKCTGGLVLLTASSSLLDVVCITTQS